MPNDPAIAARAKRKAYVHIVLPLFIASVIAYLDRVNISYAALTMNQDLGFTAQMFGLAAGIFFAGYVLFEIPGALIAERYSPRLWLARIMISWGLVSALMAFVHTRWQLYALRFALGAAEASLYPVIYASCIPRWFAPRDRARAIAVLLTSLQTAGIIGAPLAGWLVGVSLFGLKGWQVLFLVEAVPAVLFGCILVFWMADWPRQARWLTDDEKRVLRDEFEREVAAKSAATKYTVGQALRDREVVKLAAVYFLWLTGFWGFNYWLPTVLKAASGWSNLAVGELVAIPMVISLAVMVYIGHSSSRQDEKRWHGALGLFLGAIGLGVGVFLRNPAMAFVFLIVAAVGVYAPFGVWWSYPTTFLSGAAAAGAIGMINSCGNIGGFVGPYLTGWIKDTTGSFATAWVYLAVCLLASGLLVLTFKKPMSTRKRVGAGL